MRLQFGLRRFAEWGIVVYLLISVVHLVAQDLSSAIAARAALGFAASPLTTLAILYMLEAVPKRLAPVGLLFGFAKKYWVALLARAVGGFLNGNVAVMQTMVAEMVKKPEHERKWLTILTIWALSAD